MELEEILKWQPEIPWIVCSSYGTSAVMPWTALLTFWNPDSDYCILTGLINASVGPWFCVLALHSLSVTGGLFLFRVMFIQSWLMGSALSGFEFYSCSSWGDMPNVVGIGWVLELLTNFLGLAFVSCIIFGPHILYPSSNFYNM